MSEATKACNLTKYEIKGMIKTHCEAIFTCIGNEAEFDEGIERINYLYKRLKAFNEPVTTGAAISDNQDASKGWVSN